MKHIVKMTRQGQHEFDTTAYTQTESLGDSTRLRRGSDIYDCLALHKNKVDVKDNIVT